MKFTHRVFSALMALTAALLLSTPSFATVSLDRDLRMGEGAAGAGGAVPENGVAGQVVGSGVTNSAAGDTVDNQGPSGSYLGLVQQGDPVYANVVTGPFARPGTSSGDTGILFDGTDDLLRGIPLNRPDEIVTFVPGHFDYAPATTRGLQGWVYPQASALGSSGSPTTFQSIVFDTIFSGGPAINAEGQWTQINSFHGDGANGIGVVPASVDVPAGDTWYHVMHHNFDATEASSPQIVPGTGAARPFTSVLYVDGVAVSANNDNVNLGGDPDFDGLLVVGAAELDTDNASTIEGFGNHFSGVVDNLEMYVHGSGFGTFDLFSDNAWIANEIANTVPGGVLVNGDVNKDGTVNQSDVAPFVAGWLSSNELAGTHNSIAAGDWNTWDNGDMNHDGITDLGDLFIMNQALASAGVAGISASMLSGGAVPEPSTVVLIALAASATLLKRPRKTL